MIRAREQGALPPSYRQRVVSSTHRPFLQPHIPSPARRQPHLNRHLQRGHRQPHRMGEERPRSRGLETQMIKMGEVKVRSRTRFVVSLFLSPKPGGNLPGPCFEMKLPFPIGRGRHSKRRQPGDHNRLRGIRPMALRPPLSEEFALITFRDIRLSRYLQIVVKCGRTLYLLWPVWVRKIVEVSVHPSMRCIHFGHRLDDDASFHPRSRPLVFSP